MSRRRLILGIFILTIVIRLVCLALTFRGNDSVAYFEDVVIANNLLQGNGYSISQGYRNFLFYEVFLGEPIPNAITSGHHLTALKTPIYPLIIWATFSFFGADNFLALFLLHILIAGLTAVLIYMLIEPFSHLGAMVGAVAFAVYPPFVYHAVTSPESTVIMLLWLACCLVLALRIARQPAIHRWVALGLLGACMTLTDPVSVPFFGLVVLFLGFHEWRNRRSIFQAVVPLILTAFLVLPWCVRNTLAFNHFVLLKTPVGQNFARGLQSAGIDLPRQELLELEKKGRTLNEAEEDQAMRGLVWAEFSKDPVRILRAFPRNLMNFWWETARYQENNSESYVLGRKVPYVLLLIAGLIAIALSLWNLGKRPLWFLDNAVIETLCLILMVSYTVVFTAFGSWNLRYHFPVELGLIIMAGVLASGRDRNTAVTRSLVQARSGA